MKRVTSYLACAVAAGLLAACGGGTDEDTQPAATPARLAARAVAQAPAQAPAEATTVARTYQALFGKAPGNAQFTSAMAQAAANPGAFAVAQAANYASLSDAALAKLVLDNMGFTAYSVNPASYTEIAGLVTQLFTAYGPASRGAIVLNLANILGGLGNDATFGKAATLFNQKVAANLQYSTNPANVSAGVVGAGIFYANYDSPRDGGFFGYDTLLEDGRYYSTQIYRDGGQVGQLAAMAVGVLGTTNTKFAREMVLAPDFTDDPDKIGSFLSGVYYGRSFNGAVLSAVYFIPGFGTYTVIDGAQLTYTDGSLKSLYADPLPLAAVAGTYAGFVRTVGIQQKQTNVPELAIGNDGTFTTTVNGCTFNGKLAPYGSSSVLEAQASTSGANCAFKSALTGVAVLLSLENSIPKYSIGLISADSTQVATFIVMKK